MGILSEKLRIIIDADTKGAIRGLEKVGKSADREIGKAEDKIGKFSARFTKAGAAMMATGGLLAAGLYSAAQSASDLSEAINVTGLVFDDAAESIVAWSKSSATALGQSQKAALEAASTFGGLLKNLGFTTSEAAALSPQLVELASDMGSAFNMEPAEAVLALGAGLRGESEPLKRFNVFLDDASVRAKAVEMGLAATAAQVDNNGKAQARLALIMEQTSDIQGDFANTAEGAANQQRIFAAQMENLKATIGQAALPVLTDVLGVLNDLVGVFNDLPPGMQDAIGKFLVGSTAVLGFGGAALFASGKMLALKKVVDEAGGFKAFATSLSTKLNPALLAFAGLAIGTALILKDVAQEKQRAEERAIALRAAMAGMGDETVTTADRLSKLVTELGNVEDQADDTTDAISGLGEQWALAQLQAGDSLDIWNKMGLTLEDFVRIVDDGTDTFQQLERELRSGAVHVDDLARRFEHIAGRPLTEAESRMFDWIDAQGLSVKETLDLLDALDESADAFDDVRSELEKQSKATLDQAVALGVLSQEQVMAAQAMAAVSGETDLQTAALLSLEDQINEAATAAGLMVDENGQLVDSTDEATESTESNNKVMKTAAERYFDAQDAVKDYIDELDRLIDFSNDTEDAALDLIDGVIELGEQISETGYQLGQSTLEGRKQQQMLRDLKEQISDVYLAELERTGSTMEATKAVQDQVPELYNQLTALGLTTDEIDAIIRELGLMPAVTTSDVQVTGTTAASANIEFVKGLIAGLPRSVQIPIILKAVDDWGRSIPGGVDPWMLGAAIAENTRATGGPVLAGSAYLVGERGPELFVPNQSGHVVNDSQLASMAQQSASAGGTTVTIEKIEMNNHASAEDLSRELAFQMRRMGLGR